MSYSPPQRTVTMDEAVATIVAMRHQEDTGYLSRDFLRQPHLRQLALDVDAGCRKKMAAWSYQVVDFCKFNRESVEISLSYLDRYLHTPSGTRALQDRSVFQLAAMTSLYTAVKINEPEAMDPKLVSSLSRGTYSPDDVEKMEQILLEALQWRVNPPTALSFVRKFLELIPSDVVDDATRKAAYDITKFQAELAVSEYEFISVRASVTAYCSLVNSLETLVEPNVIKYVSIILQEAAGICGTDNQIVEVQNYLFTAVMRQPEFQHVTQKHASSVASSPKPASKRRASFEVSPRAATVQL